MPVNEAGGLVRTLKLIAGLLLLLAAANSVWETTKILAERRTRREELAEISHVRYGLLNADTWAGKIVPIINAQIDALDLTAAKDSLKPTVVGALNTLLDQVKDALVPKPVPGAKPNFVAAAQAAIITNMLAGLKPRVPEYADTVLKELGKPATKKAVKDYLKSIVQDGLKGTFGAVDMTSFNRILKQYNCKDGVSCQAELGRRIAVLDGAVNFQYLMALGASLLAFIILGTSRLEIFTQLLFCIALLAGGLMTPMLEVEAKISSLSLTFYGTKVMFPEQLFYYQSKSVLEVFRTLINMGEPQMVLVGVLVLMFSVVFPIFKIIAVCACLTWPSLIQRFWLARFFALESSKWSMADVMALAIFMSFVAFNGIIGNAMNGLKGAAELIIPTDSSKILPGFYLFIGFCLTSLWLAKKLEKGLRALDSAELP